jgi:histidine decarboxylase
MNTEKLKFTTHQQLQLEVDTNNFLWYPRNISQYEHTAELMYNFWATYINQAWNPYNPWNITINSHLQEQWVVEYYGELFGLDKEEIRWYVWSSGTEWNMQGIYMAINKYPEGEIFFSQDTHYSIPKTSKFTRTPSHIISSQSHGEINYDALKISLQKYKAQCELSSKPCQPIIILTLGTTVTWAVDQPAIILNILKELEINEHYIHIDGALAWWFWPFIQDSNKPHIWFDLNIDSISISWHKFIGCPIPAGIFITRKTAVLEPFSDSEYIGSEDLTVWWSRSGMAPLILGQHIEQRSAWFACELQHCLDLSTYLIEEIKKHIPHYNPWKNPYSTTVIFRKPTDRIIKKYSLACQWDTAHVVVMQHVTKWLIDQFIQDLIKDQLSEI